MADFVLVTGAYGGIGRFLVTALAEAGWSVVGVDNLSNRCPPSLSKSCHSWIEADLAAIANNTHKLSEFCDAVLLATEGLGPSAIVHNAAVQRLGKFHELTAADWHETFDVNLIAPVLISRSFLPHLVKNKGSIVHIGSIHSQLSKPDFTAYASSKAALSGLTKAMAVELGQYVRVNAIEPAAISTSMLEAGFSRNPQLKQALSSYHPTGSIGSPMDVARAMLFLLDTSNSFINGCVLPLGGGIHNRLHDPA